MVNVFEIELNNQQDTKEIMYQITMCTKRVKFIVKRDKKGNFILKVYTTTHLLDIIDYLKRIDDNIKVHKITFKIDGIKHWYYIGVPF